ncbi:MAG: DUF5665 domain-containing protein [Thermincola sp.]|jgi:hypothetical protein|nr:DUF5665 domain-containing protein [Thermincola sp.]MDT3704032.1 DUF5665 domain-containing protein [Thermincola sp.]
MGKLLLNLAEVIRLATRNPIDEGVLTQKEGYLEHKIEQLGIAMEKMKLAEYVELLNRPARLFYINFFSGVARGLGMAVGFTILGGLLILVLRKLQVLNIPVIGGLIAEVVRIVQTNLRLH